MPSTSQKNIIFLKSLTTPEAVFLGGEWFGCLFAPPDKGEPWGGGSDIPSVHLPCCCWTSGNRAEAIGTRHLAEALKGNATLREINLGGTLAARDGGSHSPFCASLPKFQLASRVTRNSHLHILFQMSLGSNPEIM